MTALSFGVIASPSFQYGGIAEKVKGFRLILLYISKTIHLILTKLISLFRQSFTVSFEIKNWRQAVLAGLQNMTEEKKKYHFS